MLCNESNLIVAASRLDKFLWESSGNNVFHCPRLTNFAARYRCYAEQGRELLTQNGFEELASGIGWTWLIETFLPADLYRSDTLSQIELSKSAVVNFLSTLKQFIPYFIQPLLRGDFFSFNSVGKQSLGIGFIA